MRDRSAPDSSRGCYTGRSYCQGRMASYGHFREFYFSTQTPDVTVSGRIALGCSVEAQLHNECSKSETTPMDRVWSLHREVLREGGRS